MNQPLVSIICLSYNHKAFVQEAIESVWNQSYSNIELIMVDDGSKDGSKDKIQVLIEGKNIQFINLKKNHGYTKAFNKGFEASKGTYIVDFAADDVLEEFRIEKQINFFQSCSDKVGVIYSDAIYINSESNKIAAHFSNPKLTPHTGDVYRNLIEYYFIPTQTMLIRRSVLVELNGYDESLAYEDFDFWIRSSRNWHYEYQAEALTFIRKTNISMSSVAYLPNSSQIESTYMVCEKIKKLNKNGSEDNALAQRLKYEFRQAAFSGNNQSASSFYKLLIKLNSDSFIYLFLYQINKFNLNLSFIRNLYLKVRY